MHLYIDLGTSHFRALSSDGKLLINEPAVVAYRPASRPTVGSRAEQMIGRHPDIIDITRPLNGSIMQDLDAAVEVIRYAVQRLQPNRFLRKFSVTLSCPSDQSQVDRKALEEAARMVGARQVQFVESSIAAAIGAGLPVDKPTGCFVVNLGGGRTEVSLISMGGIVDSRSLNSGGRAIDQEIVDLIRKEFAFVIGIQSAEQLKREASQPSSQETFEVRGRNLSTGLPETLVVPRRLLASTLHHYNDRIVRLIVEAIEACPPELVGDIIDHGVILVGGGAYMKGVVSDLANRIDVPVVSDEEPDTCIIRGLAQTKLPTRRGGTWTMPRLSFTKYMGRASSDK